MVFKSSKRFVIGKTVSTTNLNKTTLWFCHKMAVLCCCFLNYMTCGLIVKLLILPVNAWFWLASLEGGIYIYHNEVVCPHLGAIYVFYKGTCCIYGFLPFHSCQPLFLSVHVSLLQRKPLQLLWVNLDLQQLDHWSKSSLTLEGGSGTGEGSEFDVRCCCSFCPIWDLICLSPFPHNCPILPTLFNLSSPYNFL